MSTRWLVACDLDQTLIYSRRAFRLPPGSTEPPVVAVEVYDGAQASFLTVHAATRLATLAAAAEFVPVTTRTLAQFDRIQLDVPIRYAIAANGGHVLVDGRPDPAWSTLVRRRLTSSGHPLHDVVALARDLADPAWVRTWRVADELFVYLVATERRLIPDLADVERQLASWGWGVSVQGRKVYLVPNALTKQAAVEHVAALAGADAIAAAGDSLLDAEMLDAADVGIRPAHGELHDAAWRRPHVRVTAEAGLIGGQAVVDSLLAVAGVTLRSG